MKLKKDNTLYDVMLLVQTVLAVDTLALAIGYIYEKALLELLTLVFSLFMIVLAFNSYKYFKLKYLSVICIIIALLFVIGVIL